MAIDEKEYLQRCPAIFPINLSFLRQFKKTFDNEKDYEKFMFRNILQIIDDNDRFQRDSASIGSFLQKVDSWLEFQTMLRSKISFEHSEVIHDSLEDIVRKFFSHFFKNMRK